VKSELFPPNSVIKYDYQINSIRKKKPQQINMGCVLQCPVENGSENSSELILIDDL